MNLLVITQKVDKDDDILGVYHRWLEELSRRVERLSVICLYRGRVELPENVSVHSLGKETGHSRFKYLRNFYRYIWRLRKNYDVVFIHMNPEYVILGGPVWALLGKKIVLWYAHYLGTIRLRVAAFLSDKIVTSVREAFPFPSRKLAVIGQGVDTDIFKPTEKIRRKKNSSFRLLFLGRISPVKDLETLLQAFQVIKESGGAFFLYVVGEPTDRDRTYGDKIRRMTTDLGLNPFVSFLGRVGHRETPAVYQSHDLFVNLTRTGSFDKSTLEAMACGTPVLVCNRAFLNIFPVDWHETMIFKEKDSADLAAKIIKIESLDREEKRAIVRGEREIIEANHSLNNLADRLLQVFRSL